MPVSKCAEQQKTATPPFQTDVPEGRPVLLPTVLLNILFPLFCRRAIQEVRVGADMFMAEFLIIKKKVKMGADPDQEDSKGRRQLPVR